MIDTHSHIYESYYKNRVDDVIKDALDDKVKYIICCGVDKETSYESFHLAEKYNEVFFSGGIFPTESFDNDYSFLDELIKSKKMVAIGECGIDLHYENSNLEDQKNRFETQIKYAISHDLPVIIHSRDAFNETYEIIKKYKGKLRGVIHCFSYGFQELSKFLELGLYIGIDGPITYKNNDKLREIIKKIPLNRLLLETDSPYLTPVPYRKLMNETKYIKNIYLYVSIALSVDFNNFVDIIRRNALALFSKIK
ncbi:MAG: TatD family hydrolase [Acholeplasmatales bacterium]|jgi:TatD DNase family protein|nr:TatD family hydrolase [Acholeplasmatales bacterium]